MGLKHLAAVAIWLACAAPVAAQDRARTPPAPARTAPSPDLTIEPLLGEVGATEWMVTGGPAFGVEIFHSVADHRYLLQTVSWARVLTNAHGPGFLRGRFAWAVEAAPIYGQYEPTATYGFGIAPLVWRWNFESHGRVAPYAELAGGALFTRDPVPAGTTGANFTAHAAVGMRLLVRARHAFVVSYRFHHLSNGNRLDINPGVNAHALQVGLSYLRSPR
jgi:hypothetical protein